MTAAGAVTVTRPGARPRYRPGAAILTACLGAFLAFIDSTVVNVAFPNIQAHFPHAHIAGLSWVLNAYNVVFAGLMVLSGRFGDLLGRRRVFLLGLVVFTASSALCAAAPSVATLIVFRVIQGAGAAALVPSSAAIVVNASPASERSAAIGLWAAASALAAGLGPPLGGALVDAYNWRLVFLINVPFGLITWVLARRTIVESRAAGRRRLPDIPGAAALSIGLGAVSLGIVEGPSWGWGSVATVGAFAVAAAGAAVATVSSMRHRSPILDPKLLRNRQFSLSLLITVGLGLGLYTYLLTHILWLHYVWGYSLLLAGLSVAPGALVATAVARPLGHLADRYGTRVVAVPGALAWTGAYIWYATRVGIHPDFLGEWLPGQVLSGLGVGATLPVIGSGGLITVSARNYASASALNATARQVGGVVGISVLTVLVAHQTAAALPGELRHGWDLAAGAFAAAAVITLFFGRAEPATEDTGSALRPSVTIGAGAGADGRPDEGASGAALVTAPPGRALDLFDGLGGPQRERLLAATTVHPLPAGSALFSAGDPGDAMYVLESGRLEVRLPDGSARLLAPGSAVGELAVLTGSPRSATVTARRDSVVRRLDAATFETLIRRNPTVAVEVARNVARQLQESRPINPAPSAQPRVVAVVGLRPGIPVDVVAAALAGRASRACRVAQLTEPAPEALQRAEGDNDLVVITHARDADPGPVRRQADRVVLVSDLPDPDAYDFGAGAAVPTDVVLLTAPLAAQTVARWHAAVGCRRVHVAGADPGGWEAALRPLADRLVRRSIGLVLAGGGARGLAHLGVLHALEDAGVRIDRIAGTSSGAIIAAAYADLGAAATTDERAFEEMVVAEPIRGWRPSRYSLMRSDRLMKGLERSFGGLRIEALQKELVVVSTDLYRREPVYHRVGPVVDAVAASAALPILFPPRRIGNRVLVDGGLSDNLPTAAFSDIDEGPVLAVRVAPPPSHAAAPGRLPRLGEVALRLLELADRDGTDDAPVASITVIPDTRGIGLLEFHQIDVAREAGRRAGQAAVVALRQTVGEWVTGA